MTKTNSRRSNARYVFPSWRSVCCELVRKYYEEKIDGKQSVKELIQIIDRIELVREYSRVKSPIEALRCLEFPEVVQTLRNEDDELVDILAKETSIHKKNIAVYHSEKNSFIVHEDTCESYHFPSSTFTVPTVFGVDKSGSVYHPEDIDHVLRQAAIAFLIIGLPGMNYRTYLDQFILKFRLYQKDAPFMTDPTIPYRIVLKKMYFVNHEERGKTHRPKYHYDSWTAHSNGYFDGVRACYVTGDEREPFLNAIAFCFNAMLIDIAPKYVLLLNHRIAVDRNKAVANNFNESAKQFSGIELDFDEAQVGDCFAKTIRGAITEASQRWDSSRKPPEVFSDSDAVRQAGKLGLIDIPVEVQQIIYNSIIRP